MNFGYKVAATLAVFGLVGLFLAAFFEAHGSGHLANTAGFSGVGLLVAGGLVAIWSVGT